MKSRPSLLLIGNQTAFDPAVLAGADWTQVNDAAQAAEQLRINQFSSVVAEPNLVKELLRDNMVLDHLDTGVAILDLNGCILWANQALIRWCAPSPVGEPLLDALTGYTASAYDPDPFAQARNGSPMALRLEQVPDAEPTDHASIELTVRPLHEEAAGPVTQLLVTIRNITSEVEQQKKLDALHQAGRELSGLDPMLLSEMNVPTRIELLKQNLRRCFHDLLSFDIIELRLLDRSSRELRPLLQDGMTDEAASRVLMAEETGNGVTGYVAATGISYLCPDTAADPLYLEGATGARSSMTVPLKFNDEVVGTLNVESPRTNGFGPDDLQFTELFSKEIAVALHTLDLLTAQQNCTASQSIDAVNRQIAIPMDEILTAAARLLAGPGGADPESAEKLKKILDAARQVKDSVHLVGQEMVGAEEQKDCPLYGKRILVLDTDERVRRQAHLLLARLGAVVETATSSSDALALLAESTFDAVFQDVKPPDMGGYETYRRIRAAQPKAVVALTTGFGYDSAHSIVKARQDGMKHVLYKPFRPDQVINAVLDRPPTHARTASSTNGKAG